VRRTAVLALTAAFFGALSAAVFVGIVRATASPQATHGAHLPRVDSTLPSWLAPGGAARVEGFAGADQHLRLETTAGAVLARARSGRLGHFVFRVRAPDAGRYRLRVVAGSASVPVGTLLVRPLVLDAVGDITFGEQVGPTLASRGAAYPWAGVAGELRSADLTVGNLESSVSTRGIAQIKKYTFRGSPEVLHPLAHLAGFDALTLANNHSGDFGGEALLDTVRHVRAAGIQPFGAGADRRRAGLPAIVAAGGLKVAFLGYSDVNPLGFTAGAASPGTAKADVLEIADRVRAARRRADVVACFFHWGVELEARPDARQQQFATACLSGGARVVLGSHPHVLGPLSRPGPRSVVAWTLGNFVFPSSGITARTAILQVRLGSDGVRGARLLPVRIDGFRPALVR